MNQQQELKNILQEMALALREVHRHVIESERLAAEHILQRTVTPFDFLSLLANDTRFAWLQPFSKLVINVDVLLEEMQDADRAQVPMLAEKIDRLLYQDRDLNPSIARRYDRLMATDAAFVLVHARMKKALRRLQTGPGLSEVPENRIQG